MGSGRWESSRERFSFRGWCCCAILLFAELWFLAAVLIGMFGRSLGVPLMFWSEERGTQFVAGLGCNLLAAQVLFTAYLADTPVRMAPGPFLAITALEWAVVQLVAVALRAAAHASARARKGTSSRERQEGPGATGSPGPHVPQTPGIRRMIGGSTLGEMASAAAAPWPFLAGSLVAGASSVGVASAGGWLIGRLEWPARIARDAAAFVAPISGVEAIAHPELHALAALITGILLLLFLLLRRIASPPLGICVALSLVAAVDGFVGFWLHSVGLTAFVVLLTLFWAGGQKYKVRLADLRDAYRDLSKRPYPPEESVGTGSALRADRLSEASLASDATLPGYDTSKKRPLVVVCTSGGGIRAAAWTAAILGRLDADPEFRPHTWLVTGASGGMVGAAVWVAAARKLGRRRVEWRTLMKAAGASSLSPVIRRLVFADFPGTLSSRSHPADRGTALQEKWRDNVAAIGGQAVDLDTPLATLANDESEGKIPSLVFTPMLIEDGRRLVLGNVRLKSTVTSRVNWLEEGGAVSPGTASVSAYHAEDVLGGAFDRVTLATAARLSASFPYVSPAAHLPTEPPRRVVDAGYYDNFGVGLACSWLQRCFEQNQEWLQKHVSGVLVIQIRDGESELSPDVHDRPEVLIDGSPGRIARATQGLTSPPEGVLAARTASTLFRNDAQLHTVRSLYATKFDKAFVATTIFELKADVSLSWALSTEELAFIEGQASSKGISRKLCDVALWIAKRIE